jgi:hypothetical protein
MKEQIEYWAESAFTDVHARNWACQWLCTFYGTGSAFETINGITQIFSSFGGNSFYLKNQQHLYPLCAHAAQSYAESAGSLSTEADLNWAMGGVMQVVEPVVMAGRLVGAKGMRKSITGLIALLGRQV